MSQQWPVGWSAVDSRSWKRWAVIISKGGYVKPHSRLRRNLGTRICCCQLLFSHDGTQTIIYSFSFQKSSTRCSQVRLLSCNSRHQSKPSSSWRYITTVRILGEEDTDEYHTARHWTWPPIVSKQWNYLPLQNLQNKASQTKVDVRRYHIRDQRFYWTQNEPVTRYTSFEGCEDGKESGSYRELMLLNDRIR